MPRQHHRLIKDKKKSDLKLLLERLVAHVQDNGGLRSFNAVDRQMLENLFSFYKRLGDLAQEEVNLVWETAQMMVKQELGKEPSELVDEDITNKKKDDLNILDGRYWILPYKSQYLSCEDYAEFVKKNSQIFIDGLGLDTTDFVHALSAGNFNVMSLALSSGGIMAEFFKEKGQKTASFKLCQCSLPWLKSRLVKMPIFKSYIHMLNPDTPYSEDNLGIQFVYKRPRNPLIRTKQEDGTQ